MYGNSERYAGEEENGITSQKMNRPIIFLGYMGAGKTTVGKAFAQDTGRRFYDLDWYIESRRHRTVKQIFDEVGEDGFRRIERNMLHEVAEFENVVVSCGGGTPCFFDNMEYMNSRAVTVYLKATPDVLFEHLKMGRTVRPLLIGKTPDEVKAFVRQQLEVREPFYSKALYTFDVSLLDNHLKIKNTVAQLRELLCI
jgi:shikimate kinase